MWVYFKRQAVFFNTSDSVLQTDSSMKDDGAVVTVDANLIATWDQETLDMFVAQFADALKNKEPVFTFDEDKPKFIMRLSGNEEEDGPSSDVDIQ